MTSETPSLRRQLLFWLMLPVFLLWLFGAAVTYGLAMDFATDAYDQAMLDTLYSLAGHTIEKNGAVVVDLPPVALEVLKDSVTDKFYYQVLDSGGRRLAGDTREPPSQFGTPGDMSKEPDFRYSKIRGEEVRVASMIYKVGVESVTIQVAQTLRERQALAEKILIGVVGPQLLIVIAMGVAIYFGVARGLAPLNLLGDVLAVRTASDLSLLDESSVPREVRALVAAINLYLQRLNLYIDAQRRFVANAAHQLRTPIAGLKTQTELALRQPDGEERDHALKLISQSADRAARLTNQLLTLARSGPDAQDSEKWSAVDLLPSARAAVAELLPLAFERSIDLGFEFRDECNGVPDKCAVRGDRFALHELMSNLIENAVRYTPSGGRVTAVVERYDRKSNPAASSACAFIVEDNGPGIPNDERLKVFERFYRGAAPGIPGSGLGLSIVQEIAHLHGAQVMIEDGPDHKGAAVKVVFPSTID